MTYSSGERARRGEGWNFTGRLAIPGCHREAALGPALGPGIRHHLSEKIVNVRLALLAGGISAARSTPRQNAMWQVVITARPLRSDGHGGTGPLEQRSASATNS